MCLNRRVDVIVRGSTPCDAILTFPGAIFEGGYSVIGYINLHGTSAELNDRIETGVFKGGCRNNALR